MLKKFSSMAIIMLATSQLTGCGEQATKTVVTEKVTKVEVGQLEKANFSFHIKALGVAKSMNKASISAKTSGNIDALFVKEGDVVQKGDKLFQIDKRNLENDVLVAKQALLSAEQALNSTAADISIAKANLEKAVKDKQRAEELLSSGAISKSEAENDFVNKQHSDSEYQKSISANSSAKAEVQRARTNLAIAEKNLEESVVKAPFSGTVIHKEKDVGSYVDAGSTVLEFENSTDMEIVCKIAGFYYEYITLGTTKMQVELSKDNVIEVPVSNISPSIDPLTRTFTVKGVIPLEKSIITGSLCDVKIILVERENLGIPNDALLGRKGGKYALFYVEGDKAIEKEVTAGFETNGLTEVLDAQELVGKQIVTSGQYFLNDGNKVEVIKKEGTK